jgi:hypothetical protein
MSGTRRRPRRHPRQMWNITNEVVAIYERMRAGPECHHDVFYTGEQSYRCRGCIEWWDLHERLFALLGLPPHHFPAFFVHPSDSETEQQHDLKQELEAALEEREVLEATRLS